MNLTQINTAQRKKAHEIEPKLKEKGFIRCIPNNEFKKGNLVAYFSYPYLIFAFDIHVNNKAYHRIKMF